MKKLIVLSLALCALNANAKLGSTGEVKYTGDMNYSNFCEAVVKDDVSMLKQNIKQKVGLIGATEKRVVKKLIAADGMLCNGSGLVSFSEQRKASKVSQFLSNTK